MFVFFMWKKFAGIVANQRLPSLSARRRRIPAIVRLKLDSLGLDIPLANVCSANGGQKLFGLRLVRSDCRRGGWGLRLRRDGYGGLVRRSPERFRNIDPHQRSGRHLRDRKSVV